MKTQSLQKIELKPSQFLRVKQVSVMTTLSPSNIWDMVARDKFPKPTKLSSRVTIWTLQQIQDWMNEQIEVA